ncbi:membrane protein [Spirochaetia bacterium]|nr:membrane protein [Spirochaetia bacterium]
MTIPPGSAAGRGSRTQALAILGACCLFLSALEYLIPKPLPFMRIGLANAPLLLGLDILNPPSFILLVLIKIFGQALLTGSLFSYIFLFSFTGTVLSAIVMYGLRKILGQKITGLIGISVLGALISNASQIALARYFIFGEQALLLLPPFLGAGIITGFALGIFCEKFISRSRWYKMQPSFPDTVPAESPETAQTETARAEKWDRLFGGAELFIAGLLMAVFFLLNNSVPLRCVQFLFFFFLAMLSGKKTNPLVTFFIMLMIVLVNLLAPYGKILAQWGPLKITAGSLEGGIRKALTLEGLIMLSAAVIRPQAGTKLRLPFFLKPLSDLLGESFRLLEKLRARQRPRKAKDIIPWLDNTLLSLDDDAPPEAVKSEALPQKTPLKWFLLLAMVLFVAAVHMLSVLL